MTLSRCPKCHRTVRNYPEHLTIRHEGQGLQQYMSRFEDRQIHRARPITRAEVRIQFQSIQPIRPESFANLTKKAKMFWRRTAIFLKTFVVVKTDIDSNHKIAEFVYRNYGVGTFNLLLLRVIRNKKYSRTFTCLGNDCFFKQTGICRTWRTHYRGRACKINKKTVVKYVKHARVIITESPEGGLVYRFPRKGYIMHRMPWWHGSRSEPLEDFRQELIS